MFTIKRNIMPNYRPDTVSVSALQGASFPGFS